MVGPPGTRPRNHASSASWPTATSAILLPVTDTSDLDTATPTAGTEGRCSLWDKVMGFVPDCQVGVSCPGKTAARRCRGPGPTGPGGSGNLPGPGTTPGRPGLGR